MLAVTLLSLGPLAEREFVSYDDLHNFVHSRAAGGLRAPAQSPTTPSDSASIALTSSLAPVKARTASLPTRMKGLYVSSSAIVDGTVRPPAFLVSSAHVRFAITARFSGSTSYANSRFFVVYSWPQYTFVCGGSAASASLSGGGAEDGLFLGWSDGSSDEDDGFEPPAILCIGRSVLMRQVLDWQGMMAGAAPRDLDPLGRGLPAETACGG